MEFELTLTLTQKQSHYLREFLYGIVNTIFFNRVFRQIIPSNDLFLNTVEYPVLEDDSTLTSLINEKLDLIVSSVPSLSGSRISLYDSPSPTSQSVVNLNSLSNSFNNLDSNDTGATKQHFKTSSNIKIKFYEKKVSDDKEKECFLNCWEIWNIKVIIIQQSKQQQLLSSQSTGGVLINNHEQKFKKLEPEEFNKLIELFENNLFNIIDIIDLNKHHIPPITSFDGFPYQIEVSNDEIDVKNDAGMDINNNFKLNRLGTSNYYVQGEEILKSGFKFIKKMLSD